MTSESIDETYTKNYNAISSSTKGSVPANQIVVGAVVLTIFQAIQTWVHDSKPNA